MTPLEQATQAAIAETKQLRDEIKAAWQQHKEVSDREAILKGRIQQLETELAHAKELSDYHLRCSTEIAMQLHNVGIFVSDALHTAKTAVGNKSNGQIQGAYEQIEEALSNEPIQPENDKPPNEQRWLPNNQVR